MATSRLERVGTIFSRVEGLLRSGAMKADDRPVWWDIYRAFPPTREPLFDRPIPDTKIKPIFYEEDIIRAKFHNGGDAIGTINLLNNNKISNAKKLIQIHKTMKSEGGCSDDELYEKCLSKVKEEVGSVRSTMPTRGTREVKNTISSSFTSAQKENKLTNNIKNIFDD